MTVITNGSGEVDPLALQAVITKLESRTSSLETNRSNSEDPFVNVNPNNASTNRRSNNVPQVSGWRLVPNVGTITYAYENPGIDLLRFDIQIDTSSTMSNSPAPIPTTGLLFTYTEGDPETAYYARVRAVNTSKEYGPWSAIISSETGLVVTENITVGAVINTVGQVISSFSPATLVGDADGDSATYGSLSISTVGRPVAVDLFTRVTVVFKYTSGTNRVDIEILRDGAAYRSIVNDLTSVSANTTTADFTASLRIPNDTPDAGTHVYSARITVTNSNGPTNNILQLTPIVLVIECEEKRA